MDRDPGDGDAAGAGRKRSPRRHLQARAGRSHGPLQGARAGGQLGKAAFQATPIFLGATEQYVVDVHRGWSTRLEGKVDTTWALVWQFGSDGKIHQVLNLSTDQVTMGAFCWANYPLKPIPARLAG